MIKSLFRLNNFNSLNKNIRLFSVSSPNHYCNNNNNNNNNNNKKNEFIFSGNVDTPIPSNQISNVEKLRKKLLYQSKERGMLENDLLLGSFATNNIHKLDEKQLQDYDLLLQQPDPDIFNWILNKTVVPDEFETDVLKMIQHHCKNDPLGYTRK